MNILILGAAGFIGSNLALELSEDMDNYLTLADRNGEKLEKIKKMCKCDVSIEKRDLISGLELDEILKGQNTVYHLLSTTVPATSNCQISGEIRDNVEQMAELLEACVRSHVEKVVFLSSGGTVYGIKDNCPINEETETWPVNSYGVQKVMNEKLLHLYFYLYGLDYRIIRLANPFGPYQRLDGVQGAVTTFIYRALKNEEIIVYGDGSVVRDYIYIDDAVRAIVNIANSKTNEKIYNVGSGKGVSIHQLIRIIEETLEMALHVKYLPERKTDVPVSFLDVSRYKDMFGDIVTISLQAGIRKTADFLQKEYL